MRCNSRAQDMGQAPTSGRHSGAWTGRRLFCEPWRPFPGKHGAFPLCFSCGQQQQLGSVREKSGVISMPVTAQAHAPSPHGGDAALCGLPLPRRQAIQVPPHSAQSSQLDAGRDPGNGRMRPRHRVCGSSVLFSSFSRNQGCSNTKHLVRVTRPGPPAPRVIHPGPVYWDLSQRRGG